MWTMWVIGGIIEDLIYLDVNFLDVSPIKINGSFPNYLTGDTTTINATGAKNTCLKLDANVKLMGIRWKLGANAWKIYASVTEWFANDHNGPFVHWGFDEDYEATVGWLDLGAFWNYTWTYYTICVK
jgi:hypothetical protein